MNAPLAPTELFAILGYQFKDITLLEHALTHRSMGAMNNERLEFLGDSILSYIISQALFERYPKAKEGQLTRLRAAMVKGDTLAEIAMDFGIGNYLRLGVGEMKSGGYRRHSILADALEAIMAAIYLDSDIQQVKQVVMRWYQVRLTDLDSLAVLKDPKTQLQELLQSKRKPLPEYDVVETQGEQHEQIFTVECQIAGYEGKTTGVSKNRRRAEQAAAQLFLQRLQNDK